MISSDLDGRQDSERTTFEVYLARTDDTGDRRSSVGVAPRILSGRETILLVEDDDGVRQFVYKVLTRYGYDLHVVGDPTEAIDFAESHRATIHLVLTDVALPGMSGPMMAATLWERHPESRVLLLQKPFTANVLVRQVRDVLDSQL